LFGLLCGGVRKGIPKRIEDCEVKVMALDYKGFEWGNRISSDEDSVDRFLHEGLVPQSPSVGDLHSAAEWLATYGAENSDDAQGWANVVAFLILTAESKEKRSVLAQAKKKFAEANGIPVSQVRINRNN
jgi:hypothetical protein